MKLSIWLKNQEISSIGVIGAGGKARELISMIGREAVQFQAVNEIFHHGQLITLETLSDQENDVPLMCAIGSPGVRKQIADSFRYRFFASAYSKEYCLDENPVVGVGTILAVQSLVNIGTKVGNHVQIDSGTTVGHDCVVEDFTTIAPGVTIAGGVKIGTGSFIGAGATVIERITLCPGVLIGAGAVVTRSIQKPGTYVGVPAKLVGSKTGWDALR